MRNISLILVLCLNLAACGLKGDLYLPDEQQPQTQTDAEQQQQPAQTQDQTQPQTP